MSGRLIIMLDGRTGLASWALSSLLASISCSLSGRHKNLRVKKREARAWGWETKERAAVFLNC